MVRWLVDNIGTLVLAFVLALFVWFVATQEANPIVEETYREAIRVQLLNQPPGTVLTNSVGAILTSPPNDQIEVLVRGPRLTLAALQPEDFRAVIDLSTIPLGGVNVPVTVTVANSLVRVVQQDVDQVFLRLEEYQRVTVPISPTITGVPALGHVAGDPLIEPASITLEGPASKIDPVDQAQVELSIEGARETVRRIALVRLRDAAGRPVVGFDADLLQVTVTVPITKSDEYAELLVTVNITGTPAIGYRLADLTVDPNRITVYGPPEIVSDLPGFVSTMPVDVSGANADVIQRVGLQVPEGVTPIGVQSVVVELVIKPVVTTQSFPWRPQIIGPESGLTATVSPETINVSLEGPLALMDVFNPETDLMLTLNLTGLGIGSHEVSPQALSNLRGVQVVGMLPDKVLVEIYLLPTPTPTPTPVITQTVTVTGTLTLGVGLTPAGTGTPGVTPTATPTLTPVP